MYLFSMISGCLGGVPPASLGRSPQLWEVVVVVASGGRVLSAAYTLQTEPAGERRLSVRTLHTMGSWEEGGELYSFDSEAPAQTDPWALSAQHLISSVPAVIELSRLGRPQVMVEPEAWREGARQLLYRSTLPHEALIASQPLLDPTGLVLDLSRTFPGLPPGEIWSRQDRIAGVRVERTEDCQHTASPPLWSCSGSIQAEEGQSVRLYEVESWTNISYDRRGLLEVESGYSGTRIDRSGPGGEPTDEPIAGRRSVRRR